MIRTQIQLEEAQFEALKALSAREDRPMAEIIRQAVGEHLRAASIVSRAERKRRAIAASGRFRSGAPDLSSAHDQHLAQALGG